MTANKNEFYNIDEQTINKTIHQLDHLLYNKTTSKINDILSQYHISIIVKIFENLDHETLILVMQNLNIDFYVKNIEWFNQKLIYALLESKNIDFLISIINKINDNNISLFIIKHLNEDEQIYILNSISKVQKNLIKKQLNYPLDSAGRLMRTAFINIANNWNVDKSIYYIQITHNKNQYTDNALYDVFVVDEHGEPIANIPLSKLITAKQTELIKNLHDNTLISVNASVDQEEVALIFRNTGTSSIAVVNNHNKMIGVITIDDIIDVIYQENEEDLLLLSGLSNKNNNGYHKYKHTKYPHYLILLITAVNRLKWLSLNFIEALIIPLIITIFYDTFAQNVILSALIQFVVALGGNTGMQSLSVTLRAITLKLIVSSNFHKQIFKELKLAFFNATILGLISIIWGHYFIAEGFKVGIIVFISLWINILLGALFGTLYPIILKKIKIDPAIAASICITTSTDIVGFFSVLFIASYLL